MWKFPNSFWNIHESAFIMFLIILSESDLEFIFPSLRWNLRGVCEHTDIRWQLSCSRFSEFSTPNSNAIIRETRNFFWIFCLISGLYIEFLIFWKKRWSSLLMYFRNYRLWKSLLENSLRSTVSEQAFAVNMSKRPNCFRNLHESAFIMFFSHSHGSWFGICLT